MKKQNKNKIKEGNQAVTAVLYILAAVAALITLYPMYYVLILSLSDPAYAATMRVYLLPKGFNLSAFEVLITDTKMWRAYTNTILYVLPTTVLMIATSTVVAFGLNYKKLIGRKFLTMFLLIPMYFAGGTIPSFLLMVKLGLYDNPLSQIIPACFSIWNIILVKAYFRSIPESLTEAARIDGCSDFGIFTKIILPVIKPAMASWGAITLIARWNDFFWPLLYLRKQAKYTLMVTISLLPVSEGLSTPWPVILAGTTLVIIPIIILYLILEKFQKAGMMEGAVKG